MAYVARRVLKADGKKYQPGDTIDGNPEQWRSFSFLVGHGYITGYPDALQATRPQATAQQPNADSNPVDLDVEALREEAKALGIKSYANMKPETLVARIEEAKANADNSNSTPPDGGQQDPPTASTGTNGADSTTEGGQSDNASDSTGGDVNGLDVQRGSDE